MADVSTRHPDYEVRALDWQEMRDTAEGAVAVKSRGAVYSPSDPVGGERPRIGGLAYLPVPDGFTAQRDGGMRMFSAYVLRAMFPEIVAPTVAGLTGLIHKFEFGFEGIEEAGLGFLWERATRDRLPLETFHQETTRQICEAGRIGILVDVPGDGGDGMPFFAHYRAEAIINWRDDRTLYVLNESGKAQNPEDEFGWRDEESYRVLRLTGGVYTSQAYDRKEPADLAVPTKRGGGPLDAIPFVVAGARSLAIKPEVPPLIGVARSALALFRLDADYRHQLYMSGQDTLFIIGANPDEAPEVLGAGVIHTLPKDASAMYVGITGSGIEAHERAKAAEWDAAVQQGARMFDASEEPTESGRAKQIRYAAETASVQTIANQSAKAMEASLRYAARFLGATDAQVEGIVVSPPTEFVDQKMTPADAEALTRVWMQAGISKRTLFENLQKGGIVSPERDFEDEEGEIEQDVPDEPAVSPVLGGGPKLTVVT